MLEGKNIRLRPLKMEDWKKTIQWRNNIALKQLAMMHPFPVTEFIEKAWFRNILKDKSDKTIYFTIEKKNHNPIGFVVLDKINYTHKNCKLGIIIGEPFEQGKGYGRESMELIINYAFNTLNLNKITLEVVENNTNAINLYTKLGFNEEGRLKKHFFSEGKYLDIFILSLFKR